MEIKTVKEYKITSEIITRLNNETIFDVLDDLIKLNQDLLNDFDFMIEILIESPRLLKCVSNDLLNNKLFIKTFLVNKINEKIPYDKDIYEIIGESIRNDKEIVYIAVKEIGSDYFTRIPEEMKRDYDLALEAVAVNPFIYKYIPEELKTDKFVKECIKFEINIYEFIDEKFKNDVNIILKSLMIDVNNYKYIPQSCLWNEDVLKVLFLSKVKLENKIYGRINDKEIAILAVKSNSMAYNYLNNEMKNDEEVKYTLIIHHGSLHFNNYNVFINDKDIALKLLKADKLFHNYISPHLRKDKDILIEYSTDPLNILCNINYKYLIDDKEFIIKCYDITSLKHVFIKNIALEAISKELIEHVKKHNERYADLLSDRLKCNENVKKDESKKSHHIDKWLFINNNKYTQNIPNITPIYCKEPIQEILEETKKNDNLNDIIEILKLNLNIENPNLLKDIYKKLENMMIINNNS